MHAVTSNMHITFIPAKYQKKITIPKEIIKKLPKSLALFSSIQFIDQLNDIKKFLEEKGLKIYLFESQNYYYSGKKSQPGLLIGCNMSKFEGDFDAFLYIGDGVFHPNILLFNNNKDVYVFNPKILSLQKLDRSIKNKVEMRKKGNLIKFYSGKNIGVLISTKPGQNYLKQALMLKKKFQEKRFYFLIFDNIEFNQLENFNFIDCFVNTACPRIGLEDQDEQTRSGISIINLYDIK